MNYIEPDGVQNDTNKETNYKSLIIYVSKIGHVASYVTYVLNTDADGALHLILPWPWTSYYMVRDILA